MIGERQRGVGGDGRPAAGTFLSATTSSPEGTEALGRGLAAHLRPGDAVLVSGALGSGKTTLVRGIAAGLGFEGDVTSPTFTLVHFYAASPPLVHADLWRLERRQEIEDLALDEELAAGNVVVAEWGEAAEDLFSGRALLVAMSATGGEDERRVEIDARARAWSERAGALAADIEEREL
ncbi:MAG: tRNA (adenosine(37)-N6)-threonylcarbamoyltransferase complex ATPase subunit type 1 TsaE [Acidimicrobiales bacterium]